MKPGKSNCVMPIWRRVSWCDECQVNDDARKGTAEKNGCLVPPVYSLSFHVLVLLVCKCGQRGATITSRVFGPSYLKHSGFSCVLFFGHCGSKMLCSHNEMWGWFGSCVFNIFGQFFQSNMRFVSFNIELFVSGLHTYWRPSNVLTVILKENVHAEAFEQRRGDMDTSNASPCEGHLPSRAHLWSAAVWQIHGPTPRTLLPRPGTPPVRPSLPGL